MAQKPRRPWLDLLTYAVVRGVVAVLQAVPFAVSLRFAELLAEAAYAVDRRHREVARENLASAFPEKSPVEIDRLVRGCYRHFCLMLVELVWLPRKMSLETWYSWVSLRDPSVVDALLGERAVLMVTAHFGNWEVAGYVLGMIGFKSYAIARTLDNPHLDRFLNRFRQKTGQTILCKKGDYDKITAVLADKGILATLGDQDAGERGLFVPFFGRPASSHKAVALMAIEYDALMIVVGVPRVSEPMRYEIVTETVIDPRDYAARPDAVRAITERFTAALEVAVRRHPEQYFWLHRRWKHQPPVRKRLAA